jgi:cbb3-type cytochrome c oxidase subunit III
MPAYSYLNEKDLSALIAYVQSRAGRPEHVAATDEGRRLYMTNCLSCHGAQGAGDGFAGAALPRPAANFTAQQPTADFAYRAISDGIAGTAMPQWKTKFTEAQRHALSDYVRSLYSVN